MQCPDCGHQAPVADFGDPLRCPDCGIYYEKAVIARDQKARLDQATQASAKRSASERPHKVLHFLVIAVAVVGILFTFNGVKRYFDKKNHLAPIMAGAIPDRIGCDVGCGRLNDFRGWQPYLQRVAEVVRRDYQCKRVDYVSVSNESVIPDNPKFFAVCDGEFSEPGKDGRPYVTEHFKKVIDLQYRRLNLK